MRFALTSIVVFALGYAIGGGELKILEFLYTVVWDNALGEAIHEAFLNLDDDRLKNVYAAFRMDFSYGPALFILGLVAGFFLAGRFALLPCFLVVGMVVRMWVPLIIEVSSRFPIEEVLSYAAESAPKFVWDITLIPTCILGIAIARLIMLRRIPRWRIRDAACLTLFFAFFFLQVVENRELVPYVFFPIVGLLSLSVVLQTDIVVDMPPNNAVNRSGEVGRT